MCQRTISASPHEKRRDPALKPKGRERLREIFFLCLQILGQKIEPTAFRAAHTAERDGIHSAARQILFREILLARGEKRRDRDLSSCRTSRKVVQSGI